MNIIFYNLSNKTIFSKVNAQDRDKSKYKSEYVRTRQVRVQTWALQPFSPTPLSVKPWIVKDLNHVSSFPVKAIPIPSDTHHSSTTVCPNIPWSLKGVMRSEMLKYDTSHSHTQSSLRKSGLLPVITVWLALLSGPAASFAVLLWGFWAFLVVVVLQLKLSPSFGWQRRWGRHG